MPVSTDTVNFSQYKTRLETVEKDFEEGDITIKGYWKKRCVILEPLFPPAVKKSVSELGEELKSEEITEKGYYKKLEQIIANFLRSIDLDNGAVNGNSGSDVEKSGNVNAGATNGHLNGKLTNGHTNEASNGHTNEASNGHTNGETSNGHSNKASNGHSNEDISNGHSNEDITNGHSNDETINGCSKITNGASQDSKKLPASFGKATVAQKLSRFSADSNTAPVKNTDVNGKNVDDSGKSDATMDLTETDEDMDVECLEDKADTDEGSPPKKRSRKENGGGDQNSPGSSKSAQRKSSRRPANKSNGKQPSIMSMFSPRPKVTEKKETEVKDKKKEEKTVEESEEQASKRIKLQKEEEKNGVDSEDVIPVVEKSPPKPLPQRCNECLKYLNDPELRLFPGDADDAVEEFIALTDKKTFSV